MPQLNDEIAPDGSVEHVPATAADVTQTSDTTPLQVEKEVTHADEVGETVDMSDFLAKKDGIEKEPAEKKVETAPVVDKKAPEQQPKVEDKKVEPTTKPPVAEVAKPKGARDYTGIPADMVPLFQKMSNEGFDKFKPMYLEAEKTKQELAELKAKPPVQKDGLPDSYYEHPAAFVLTPEFTKASTDANEAELVQNHWKEQLDAVRGNATEYITLKRNEKGEIVYGPTVKVGPTSQSDLEQLFMTTSQQAAKFAGALTQVQQSFQAKHSAAMKDLREFESSTFKAFEDPNHPLQPMLKDTLSKVNPIFAKNPLTSPLAKAMITIIQLQEQLTAAKTPQATVQQKVEKAQSAAGPTATSAADNSVKKDKEVTMDDFMAVKNDF